MPHNTKIVAIINVTPDSFSDGGENYAPEKALGAIKQAIADGAYVVDIGAESTRPGAEPLTANEEWKRLGPVLRQCSALDAVISVDTYHPENARRALALGADWINDVSGFTNPAMVEAVKDSGCKLVVMHSLTVPADKAVTLSESCDPVTTIITWAEQHFATLEKSGIERERLIFDPGIGFAKTAAQSKEILERASEFKALGVPLFIGHSRKSFLHMQADTNDQRDGATLALSRKLAASGVDYLRVHNIRLHTDMLQELTHVA